MRRFGIVLAGGAGAGARPAGWRRPGPSRARGPVTNLPLPRFVSMRAESANARRGPSLDQRVDWAFVRRGLPLEVVAEYGQWRRVRDAEGYGGWVHHTLLSGVRTALVTGEAPVPLLARPEEGAAVRAMAEPGVVGRLEACREAAGARSTPAASRAGCRGRRSGAWGRRKRSSERGAPRRPLRLRLVPPFETFVRVRTDGGNAILRRDGTAIPPAAFGLDAPRKHARGSALAGDRREEGSDARRHRGPDDPACRLRAAGFPRRPRRARLPPRPRGRPGCGRASASGAIPAGNAAGRPAARRAGAAAGLGGDRRGAGAAERARASTPRG